MWKWPWWRVVPLFGLLLLVDLAFLAGSMTKIASGGWVPLAFAGGDVRDVRHLARRPPAPARRARRPRGVDQETARAAGERGARCRAPRCSSSASRASCRRRCCAISNTTRCITSRSSSCTSRSSACRASIRCAACWSRSCMPGVYDVRARFGFMETPDVGEALRNARRQGLKRVRRGFLVLPRLAPGSRASAAGVSRAQVARFRVPAAPQRAGGRVLPHADARRRSCSPPTSSSDLAAGAPALASRVIACPAASANIFVASPRPFRARG